MIEIIVFTCWNMSCEIKIVDSIGVPQYFIILNHKRTE
jgi:hypothetical protein